MAEREDAQKKRETEYEMWLRETQANEQKSERDYIIDRGKLALDRDKFEYAKTQDEKENEKESPNEEKFNYYFSVANKALGQVIYNEKTGKFDSVYSKQELMNLVNTFDLSDEEKQLILKRLGINY
jgi:hypothetical protein